LLLFSACGTDGTSDTEVSSPDSLRDIASDPVPVEAEIVVEVIDDSSAETTDLPTHVLGLPLKTDGVLYAGAASVEITPDIKGPGPVYIAGFGRNRIAEGVRDPLWARALVMSKDREYVAVVALDLVGMTGYRSGLAAGKLADLGWSRERLLVHTTHTHAGPDSIGMWGPDETHTGLDSEYQDRLVDAIVESVEKAAAQAVPATLRAGSLSMGSVSPYFTSSDLGGKLDSVGRTLGLIRDTRDPVTQDDGLTAIGLFSSDGDAVAALAHVHTHMEVSGGGHHLSSDFAHAARELLESRMGGTGIIWVGAVGGLQTPLGVPMPATDSDGSMVWSKCDESAIVEGDPLCDGASPGDPRIDEDGDPVPSWTSDDGWERTDSYGRLIGRLAADLLEAADESPDPVLSLDSVSLMLPIENRLLQVAGMVEDTAVLEPLIVLIEEFYPEYEEYIQTVVDSFEGTVLDFPEDHMVKSDECLKQATGEVRGCLPSMMWSLRLGPVHVLTVPGELFPELWLGTPSGAVSEYEDASLRGPGSTYFGYTDPDCADVPYEECRTRVQIGECDCLNAHAAPYVLSFEDEASPLNDWIDAPFPVLLGLTGEMTGYIIPEPDTNIIIARPLDVMFHIPEVFETVEFASGAGEHYEETVSLGPSLSRILQGAAAILLSP